MAGVTVAQQQQQRHKNTNIERERQSTVEEENDDELWRQKENSVFGLKKLNNFVDSSARKGVKSVLPIRKLLIFCQNGECCAENVVYVGFEQEINAS